MLHDVTLAGGAPACAGIEELLPDVLDGTIRPGRMLDVSMVSTWCRMGTAQWVAARL